MKLTIGVTGDFPASIAALLDMLRYARSQTIAAVQGLTTEQLDHRHDDQSNSIGALLSHIASVEAWYQTNTFESRDWTAAEEARWEGAIDLGDRVPRQLEAGGPAGWKPALQQKARPWGRALCQLLLRMSGYGRWLYT